MYVRVDLHPSALLRVSRAVLHGLAIVSLAFLDLGPGPRVVLALLVAAGFLRILPGASRQPRAILFIDGSSRLLFEDRVLEVELQEYVYCTSFLQVLHFRRRRLPRLAGVEHAGLPRAARPDCRASDCKFNVMILPDSCSVRDRRRLRTLLRWQTLVVQGQGADQ